MDISNNQTTQQQPRALSLPVRIFCCVVLLLCSAAFTLLPYYIVNTVGTQGALPVLPTILSLAVMGLGIAFAFTLCKKPLFLICSGVCVVLLVLISPWYSVIFTAFLCAAVAGTALIARAEKAVDFLPASILPVVAFIITLALTRDPLFSAYALLPTATALAMGISCRKKQSVILSVGITTGTLLASILVLMLVGALLSGMHPSVAGVTEYIKAFHASLSEVFAQPLRLMTDPVLLTEYLTPALGDQLSPAEIAQYADALAAATIEMLGGELGENTITLFADSIASVILAILPGTAIMLTWFFSFIVNRGMTALIMRGVEKKDYPVHLTAYEPSVPTAIFMILCYLALFITSLFPQAEAVSFIALNLLLALLPMMLVCGVLSIISNVKNAKIKWPILVTYALAVLFLGISTIPMIAFFGSFAVITNAVARALEKKFKDFKGEQ